MRLKHVIFSYWPQGRSKWDLGGTPLFFKEPSPFLMILSKSRVVRTSLKDEGDWCFQEYQSFISVSLKCWTCVGANSQSLHEQTNIFSGKKCLSQGYMDFSSASFPPLPAENTVFSYLQHFSKFHAWLLTQFFRPGETRFECRPSCPNPIVELVAGPTCVCRGRGAGQAQAVWNDFRYLELPLQSRPFLSGSNDNRRVVFQKVLENQSSSRLQTETWFYHELGGFGWIA